MKNKKTLFLKISVLVSFAAMIFVNFLANALPIAGKNTGAISDSYPSLFTPTGITFSIWGIIYFLLAAYVFYYLNKKDDNNKILFEKVVKFFILSSLANIAWIFCWHYGLISLSVILMLVILISLIKIADLVNKEKLNTKDQFFLRLPFSIYFGWITVATIANITALLVAFSWSGWGLSAQVWTVIILLIGALIGVLRGFKDKNIYYLLVFVWAYFGIYLKHHITGYYSGQYPMILNTTILAIGIFIISIICIVYKKKK